MVANNASVAYKARDKNPVTIFYKYFNATEKKNKMKKMGPVVFFNTRQASLGKIKSMQDHRHTYRKGLKKKKIKLTKIRCASRTKSRVMKMKFIYNVFLVF